MPQYVGLEQQGFYKPFELLGQGLQARADRKLRQQQLGIEQQSANRAERETNLRESEFGLQKPVLAEQGREATNKAALDAAIGETKPSSFFADRPPEEQASFYNSLTKHGYSGDLGAAVRTHDTTAQQAMGYGEAPMFRSAVTGQDITRPGVASSDGSPGVQPAPPQTSSANGPATATNAGVPQLSLKPSATPVVPPTVTGASGQNGVPPTPTTNTQTAPRFDLNYQPRLQMKSGEKGMFPSLTGREDPASYGAATPEQIDWLRNHPGDLAKFPPVTQKLVAPIIEAGQKNEEMLRKRISENGDLSGYMGSGTKPGYRHIEHLMDSAIGQARDPKTGVVDWSKVDAPSAFSLVYSDAQANNPGAIVRPSDVENVTGLQGKFQQLGNSWANFMSGQKLSPALKAGIYSMVKRKVGGAREQAIDSFSNIEKEANDYGVPLHRIAEQPFLDEYDAAKRGQTLNRPQVTAPGIQQPSGPVDVTGNPALFQSLPTGTKFIFSGRQGVKLK